jgi:hypothetical protein
LAIHRRTAIDAAIHQLRALVASQRCLRLTIGITKRVSSIEIGLREIGNAGIQVSIHNGRACIVMIKPESMPDFMQRDRFESNPSRGRQSVRGRTVDLALVETNYDIGK